MKTGQGISRIQEIRFDTGIYESSPVNYGGNSACIESLRTH
jgi:hypothetical protein